MKWLRRSREIYTRECSLAPSCGLPYDITSIPNRKFPRGILGDVGVKYLRIMAMILWITYLCIVPKTVLDNHKDSSMQIFSIDIGLWAFCKYNPQNLLTALYWVWTEFAPKPISCESNRNITWNCVYITDSTHEVIILNRLCWQISQLNDMRKNTPSDYRLQGVADATGHLR